MIEVGKTVVSRDVFQKEFVCNLSACKGECCVAGDAGAPLTVEEKDILGAVYTDVKPYMTAEGIASVEKLGTSIFDEKDQEFETPLNNGKECAYVFWGTDGTALCAIEQAYNEGKITWQKPLSCHLYPIRIKAYKDFDAINYDKWEICSDACVLGKELHVPVYKFLKTPLIRKYGEEWYKDLEEIAALVEKEL
jgi:hypothetical protein